jgi:hypothetical protein
VPAGPYCIPRGPPGSSLSVLAIGDSITQGSVPSKNLNHPYTINLEKVLESMTQVDVRALDAGRFGGWGLGVRLSGGCVQ